MNPDSRDSSVDSDGLWYLDGQTDDTERVHRVPILAFPFKIGRRPGRGLTIASNMISSQHAEIYSEDGRLAVRDLGSTNGTFVNQERLIGDSPLAEGDILHFAQLEFRLGYADALEAETILAQTIAIEAQLPDLVVDKSRLLAEMIKTRSVASVFQPIVPFDGGALLGYEVLGRSGAAETASSANTPGSAAELFRAAKVLGAEAELSQLMRAQCASECLEFPSDPEFFINTHPTEIGTIALRQSLEEFRQAAPELRVVLEIHEGTVTEPGMVKELQTVLDSLDMRLAYDDFGAGQARLVELAEVPPDYLKFDLSLIRGIEVATDARLKVIGGLVQMARDMGISTIAEGVETEQEATACRSIGFDLAQGYLFGKPQSATAVLRNAI